MEWGDNRLTVSPECLQKKKKQKGCVLYFHLLCCRMRCLGQKYLKNGEAR